MQQGCQNGGSVLLLRCSFDRFDVSTLYGLCEVAYELTTARALGCCFPANVFYAPKFSVGINGCSMDASFGICFAEVQEGKAGLGAAQLPERKSGQLTFCAVALQRLG